MAVHYIKDQYQVEPVLRKLYERSSWGADTETDGLNPFENKVLALQLGNADDQFIFDARKINMQELKPFLEDKNYKKVFHNAAFDWKMVKKSLDIDMEAIRCTMYAEQLLNVGRRDSGYGLDKVLEARLDVIMDKTQQKSFVGHVGDFTQAQIDYMADDVKYTIPLAKNQIEDLIEDNLTYTWTLECEAIAPFESMSLNGFRLDVDAWQGIVDDNQKRADEMAEMMDDIARDYMPSDMFGNVEMDYNSPQQVLNLLQKMDIKIKGKSHDGKDIENLISSSNAEVLKLVQDVPFIDMLRKYRTYTKGVTTYGKTFIERINEKTGRLHFDLKQLGTETGRPTSRKGSNYNPLNIPRDKRYRHAFLADPGYLIETDDYSACELRIWAELSNDPGLCEAFLKGLDVHSYVGSKLFKMEVSKSVNSDKRQLTKPINFGIAYGMGPLTLYYRAIGEGLEVTFEEMKELYRIYTKKEFVTGVQYLRDEGKAAFERGYATTIFGRRRYWLKPDAENRNTFLKGRYDPKYRGVVAKIQKEGGNMKIQGTNSDMVKRAMRLIYDAVKENGFRTEIKNMPYDEIVTMTHEDDSPQFVPIKRKLMLQAAEEMLNKIPMEVEGEVMKCWTK